MVIAKGRSFCSHGASTDAIAEIRQAMDQDTPAIVITADRSNEMKHLIKESGFGLVQKPLKPAVLRKLINRLL